MKSTATRPHICICTSTPHIDDPFPGQAIDYHRKVEQYAPGEFHSFVQQMNEMILVRLKG